MRGWLMPAVCRRPTRHHCRAAAGGVGSSPNNTKNPSAGVSWIGSSALERMFNLNDRLALFIDGANLYQSARALAFDIHHTRLLWTFADSIRLLRAYNYTALLDEQDYS